MHFLLAFVNMWKIYGWVRKGLPRAFETVRQGFQMVAVLAETLNFALMLTLSVAMQYSFKSFNADEFLTSDIKLLTFRRWLTIEAGMFIVTVLANIIVVLLRTFFKDRLRLDIDSVDM